IYTNQLSEFGFKHVLGIDQSEVMIASANGQAYNNHIQFEVGDIFNNHLANQSQNFMKERALIQDSQDGQEALRATKRS
ncbi:class I SAM-dependent methyltransferase, partial [Mammaliicoccus sciuri]|uniref:class I SAM-dependent methyltransferase n=1 Tax=Mammaliicoccus sciuri TaxID=1296 RepID=UPI00226FCDD5